MALRRVGILCLVLNACGAVTLVPADDGGQPNEVSLPTSSSGQGGTTAVVPIVVSPTTPDCQEGGNLQDDQTNCGKCGGGCATGQTITQKCGKDGKCDDR